jgi:SagB-type dehydrogenase family enzyme
MLPTNDARSLALLYHLNSLAWSGEGTQANAILPSSGRSVIHSLRSTPLISPATTLSELLRKRKSTREYSLSFMSKEDLSALVFGAGGLIGFKEYVPGLLMTRRVVPSAGGLYPIEIYVIVERIEGIDDGLYLLDSISQTLELQRGGQHIERLESLFFDQNCVHNANLVLVMAADLTRTLDKYGSRGYRYLLLEAGHAAENVCLIAAESGLGSVCIGGFDDAQLNDFLGLDGVERAAVYCVACGASQ